MVAALIHSALSGAKNRLGHSQNIPCKSCRGFTGYKSGSCGRLFMAGYLGSNQRLVSLQVLRRV